MTARERFLRTMRFEQADRVPFWEEGLRQDVLDRWGAQEGWGEADHYERFGLDRRETFQPNLQPIPKVRRRVRTLRALERLATRYNPASRGRLPGLWRRRARAWAARDYPLGIQPYRGLFLSMCVGDWRTLTDALYLVADEPAAVARLMDRVADLAIGLIDRALAHVQFDYLHLSEPIASNAAPVIGPDTYRRLVLPACRRIVEHARSRGIDLVLMWSQGNVNALIPLWVDVGINALWCSDTVAGGVDYLRLRRTYGRSLALLGGLDVEVLTRDKAAIEREILTKVPPLLAEGGYIPAVDGRVREYVPFENYAYYRRLLNQVAGGPP
jgi:hypothetical protein